MSAESAPSDGEDLGEASPPAPRPNRPTEEELEALRDALSTFWYFKEDQAEWIRAGLRRHPELLADLDLGQTKRGIARDIVGRIRLDPARYRDCVSDLIDRLSGFSRDFTGLEHAQYRYDLRTSLVHEARAAFDRITKIAALAHAGVVTASEGPDPIDLRALYSRYAKLTDMADRQTRGRLLEPLLKDLFNLYGLQAEGAYVLDYEQIDGSFRLDGQTFLLEAKWWSVKSQPKHIDPFARKVERKFRNTLGLFLSVGGFTDGAIESYRNRSSPVIFFDGQDLHDVLAARVSLTTALQAKWHHAARTGEPYYSTGAIIGSMWVATD